LDHGTTDVKYSSENAEIDQQNSFQKIATKSQASNHALQEKTLPGVIIINNDYDSLVPS
jgi:hypothetical protein